MFHIRKRMFRYVTRKKMKAVYAHVTKMLYLCPENNI